MSYETDDKMVSHPDHYKSGKYEVIDIIDEFTKGLEGTEAVCTANAIKYILRWKKKNGIQDVKKAIWYLTHLVEHLESEDSKPSEIVIHRMANGHYAIANAPKPEKKEPNHTCNNCAYGYYHDDVLHCGNNSGLPCGECFISGEMSCLAWESIEEESDLSVKTHTNVAGVTVPDSEPWSGVAKEVHACSTCTYELRKRNIEPCKSCSWYSNWKPKEERVDEPCSET